MNRDTLREMMLYLAQPGGVSEAAWNDAYQALNEVDSRTNIFIDILISVASRVARSRKERLPDPLHNMMILWVAVEGDYAERNNRIKKHIESYLKMVAKLNSPKKPEGRGR